LKNPNEKSIVALLVATGLASVVTQLVLIREFLSQFQGNEIVIALILFAWLVLGGLGTRMARPADSSRFANPRILGALGLVLAGLSLTTVFGARLLRDFVFTRGASVGFYPTFAYIAALTAPYALLVGFLLPLSLFVLRRFQPDYPAALAYIWDNVGDILGGALFSFIIVFWLTPVQALVCAHLPLLGTALFLTLASGRARLLASAAALSALIAVLLAEPSTLAPFGSELLHYRETRFGRIVVAQQRELVTLFQDGSPLLNSQDEAAAEEAVHYALAQRADPKRVLLISTTGGMMEELEKYRLESVDYVELDPDLTEVLLDYRLLKRFPGLTVVQDDGRAFLAAAPPGYDAILVNLGDPQTFQTNRFFTDRFFALAQARLTATGVLSFSMEGFQNYLAEPQRRKLSSLYNTAQHHFRHVLLLPGERVFFICSQQPLTADIPRLLERKGVSTRYISAYFDGQITPERLARINAWIDPATPPNSELAPYVLRTVFTEWFVKFDTSPLVFAAAVAGLLAVYLMRSHRVEFVLFTTGWTTLASELLIIFAFQIFFGYIYFKIGIIVTVFLAGLLPGALWGRRLTHRARSVLIRTDAALIGLLGLTLAAVHLGDRLPETFYLVLGFGIAMTCGLQQPAALQLGRDSGAAATGVFSADLIGAAFGTLVMSTVLIPYLGMTGSILSLAGLKLLSLGMAGRV
jgi:spermidine synthase